MTNQCSSLDLLNFVVGLTKRDRLLRPLSTEITHLGYRVIRIEPSFEVASRAVNPDAIIASTNTHHAIIVELSGGQSAPQSKTEQIESYARATNQDLIEKALIPRNACSHRSIWLICSSAAAADIQRLGYNSDACVVSQLKIEIDHNPFLYERISGTCLDDNTHQAISRQYRFASLPRYFAIDIRQPDPQALLEQVLRQLVAFAVRGPSSFTIEELSSAIVPYWSHIETRFKVSFARKVTQVTKDLIANRGLNQFIIRTGINPIRYEYRNDIDRNAVRLADMIRRRRDELINETRYATVQEELDLFTDDST